MSNFGFALKQRVFIPGEPDIQGIVTGRSEQVDGENDYDVRYIGESMKVEHVLASETVLTKAQPAPTVLHSFHVKAIAPAREQGAKNALRTVANDARKAISRRKR